jgi:hypothetical protein
MRHLLLQENGLLQFDPSRGQVAVPKECSRLFGQQFAAQVCGHTARIAMILVLSS